MAGLDVKSVAIDFGTVTCSLLVTLLTSLRYQGHFPCQVFTAVGIEARPPVETYGGRLPLTLRREDRLELFFERHRHGQAFDNHVV